MIGGSKLIKILSDKKLKCSDSLLCIIKNEEIRDKNQLFFLGGLANAQLQINFRLKLVTKHRGQKSVVIIIERMERNTESVSNLQANVAASVQPPSSHLTTCS